MAYYSRRRRGYGGYRRRRSPKTILKVIAVLLVIAVCAVAVFQTKRLQEAQSSLDALQKQVQTTEKQQENTTEPTPNDPSLPYQALYPDMKADSTGTFDAVKEKAVYLTFDDGPSANTDEILDALQAKKQKATFFVVGKNIKDHEATLKRMVNEGHTIGIHGYSHDYKATYASVDDFLKDFHETYQAVYDACGVYPTVFRFPGGSVNAYNREIYQQIIAEMLRRGFVYYDWNVSGGDMTGEKASASQIGTTVAQGVSKTKHPIVLLHDAADKKNTAKAVPSILDELLHVGYYCDALTPKVSPVTFDYND